MEYQVWHKDEYDGWQKTDCGDLAAAEREIMQVLMKGQEPLLTAVIPYDVAIKVKEDKIGEVAKGKSKGDRGPRDKSESQVRPGDHGAVSELGEGGGDSSPSDNVPGE